MSRSERPVALYDLKAEGSECGSNRIGDLFISINFARFASCDTRYFTCNIGYITFDDSVSKKSHRSQFTFFPGMPLNCVFQSGLCCKINHRAVRILHLQEILARRYEAIWISCGFTFVYTRPPRVNYENIYVAAWLSSMKQQGHVRMIREEGWRIDGECAGEFGTPVTAKLAAGRLPGQ